METPRYWLTHCALFVKKHLGNRTRALIRHLWDVYETFGEGLLYHDPWLITFLGVLLTGRLFPPATSCLLSSPSRHFSFKLDDDALFHISYLIIGELVPRLFAVGEDLPENNSQTPNIALRGKLSVHDALRGHPADWQHGVTSDLYTDPQLRRRERERKRRWSQYVQWKEDRWLFWDL